MSAGLSAAVAALGAGAATGQPLSTREREQDAIACSVGQTDRFTYLLHKVLKYVVIERRRKRASRESFARELRERASQESFARELRERASQER